VYTVSFRIPVPNPLGGTKLFANGAFYSQKEVKKGEIVFVRKTNDPLTEWFEAEVYYAVPTGRLAETFNWKVKF